MGNIKNRKKLMDSQFLTKRYLASRNLTTDDIATLFYIFSNETKKPLDDFLTYIEAPDFFERFISVINDKIKHMHHAVVSQLVIEESILWASIHLSSLDENIHVIHPAVLQAMKHTDIGNMTFKQLPEITKPLYLQINQEVILIYPKKNGITFFGIPEHVGRTPYESIVPDHKVFKDDPFQWVFLDTTQPDATIQSKLDKFQETIAKNYRDRSDGSVITEFQNDTNISDDALNNMLDSAIESSKKRSKNFIELAVKCLLYYLSSDDFEVDWNSETPTKEVEEFNKIKNQARKQVQEEALLNQGHFKVIYVGRNYAQSEEANRLSSHINSAEEGRTVSPHFRRGHFRSQAYGKERMLRRVIFIGPTFVNPDA